MDTVIVLSSYRVMDTVMELWCDEAIELCSYEW